MIRKTSDYQKVFKLFFENYQEIPLEIFKEPYKALISTVLSSRTRDEVTLEACKRLFMKAPDILKLKNLKTEELKNLIYPVGFYKTKAKHLHDLAETILLRHDGKVPVTIDELMKLPGVGRKTANLVLNRAFGKPAIAVDTHVHRICNLLGWVHTKTPEQTETELVKVIPKKYWKDMNRLFVSIGRQYGTRKKLLDFLKRNKLIPDV